MSCYVIMSWWDVLFVKGMHFSLKMHVYLIYILTSYATRQKILSVTFNQYDNNLSSSPDRMTSYIFPVGGKR